MAGKNKLYELMISIGAKKDSSLNKACLGASNDLASLGQTAKAAGKIAAGAMVAAATAAATTGTAAVKSAAEYEAQLANVSTLLTGTEAEWPHERRKSGIRFWKSPTARAWPRLT